MKLLSIISIIIFPLGLLLMVYSRRITNLFDGYVRKKVKYEDKWYYTMNKINENINTASMILLILFLILSYISSIINAF